MDEQERNDSENPGQGTGSGPASGQPDPSGNHESHGDPQVTSGSANPENVSVTAPVPGHAAASSLLHVKLAVYDGPLDLLLELIKKNEMDIYNIQIAEITRQYLDSIAAMKQLDLEVAGEFIVMAATLIYIKSKCLLPQDNTEEDLDGEDPRAELVRKLLEYQAFKEAAKELGLMEDERGKIFTRQIADYYLTEIENEDVEIDAFSANLFDLMSAFQGVLTRAGRLEMHEVFEQEVSIEERLEDIRHRLDSERRVVFSKLFGERWTRNLLIATFLAVLEIVRTKIARIVQDKQFGEIVIEKTETALAPS